jgi:hypothetical protein
MIAVPLPVDVDQQLGGGLENVKYLMFRINFN